MRVIIERSNLLKALTHVQSVVERRNTIPILSNVRLVADQGMLRLTATDLDIEIVEATAADISRSGALTVPAHMLYDIVRKLPDGGQVELDHDTGKSRVTVVSGKSRFNLQSLPAEDFPDLASGEFGHTFSIAAKDLKALIERTRFAISTEETRYYLNGIYLHESANGNLRAVATDGHRLAQSEMPRPEGAAGMPGIIVPRKTVLEIAKLIEGMESDVEISLSPSKIRFTCGDMIITSKLIDGTFPDYERVIPRNNDKFLDIETKPFAAAVDRVSTVSLEKSRAVKLGLSQGRMTLSVNNPDSGSAEEELPAQYEAEPVDIGFNSRYLLDVAGQVTADTMRFELQDAGSPTVVRDPKDAQSLYVLMPMRV